MVAQLIERGLEAGSATPIIAEPRRRPPIPIARKADGSVTPALSNAALDAILDEQAGRLVSLDSDFQRFTGLNFLHLAPPRFLLPSKANNG